MTQALILKSLPINKMHRYMLIVDGVAKAAFSENDDVARKILKDCGTVYETIPRWTLNDGILSCGSIFISL